MYFFHVLLPCLCKVLFRLDQTSLHLTSDSLQTLKPYTLHPTPYTLHPTPYTLHPTPYTLTSDSLQTDVCRVYAHDAFQAAAPRATQGVFAIVCGFMCACVYVFCVFVCMNKYGKV